LTLQDVINNLEKFKDELEQINWRINRSRFLMQLMVLDNRGYIDMKYDFDYMKDLYERDPEEFAQYIATLIEEFMESLPEDKRERYRAKQWRIEQELNGIVDPLARMNKMVSIFWNGVEDNAKKFRQLGFGNGGLSETNILTSEIVKNNAEIIDFKPKNE